MGLMGINVKPTKNVQLEDAEGTDSFTIKDGDLEMPVIW